MKLSPYSWHHRLHIWAYGEIRVRSLCPYFWMTVAAAFASPFIAMLHVIRANVAYETRVKISNIIGWALIVLLIGIIEAILLWEAWSKMGVLGLVLFAAGNGLFFGGAYGIIKLADWWIDRGLDKPRKQPKPEKAAKQPSITLEYLKAVKTRVCPILQWEDGET